MGRNRASTERPAPGDMLVFFLLTASIFWYLVARDAQRVRTGGPSVWIALSVWCSSARMQVRPSATPQAGPGCLSHRLGRRQTLPPLRLWVRYLGRKPLGATRVAHRLLAGRRSSR